MFKKTHLIFATIYVLFTILLLVLIYKFGLKAPEKNIQLIKENNQISDFIDKNITGSSIGYVLISVIWIFLLGLVSPLLFFSSFFFNFKLGFLLSIFAFTLGATLTYIVANNFFEEIAKKYLNKKFPNLKNLNTENSVFYFFMLRLIPGIPYSLKNIMAIFFNLNTKKFFLITLLAELPQILILMNIFLGFKKVINNNDDYDLENLLSLEIFFPVLGLFFFLLLAYFIKKKFFKKVF